ncbi:MAG: hypothetical protein GF317_11255 [Candidatus Lokiarchaeota archaeon]|nr:hypothetical protein [Candidatus Lokiarchaeota archaeon]MBD3200226.1 hypothetical protein [Candidatus Lokiarchaeota archaeon]
MSGLTNSKTSIKKILLLVDEIKALSTDSTPKMSEQPKNLLQAVESFESSKNENLKAIDSNTDEINSLKNKISQNEREIIKLEEEINDLTSQRQEFMNQIQEIQNKITETNDNIRSKKDEYDSRNQRLKELEEIIAELKIEQDKFELQLDEIQTELEETYLKRKRFVENYGNRVEAMKLLIKHDYIHSAQIKLIKALQKDTTLDLKNVLLAIDMREDQAEKILQKIQEENGPIEYDAQAGTITLTEEVDFK